MRPIHNQDRHAAFWPGRLSALLPLIIFVWVALQFPHLALGERMVLSLRWVPSLGVDFAFVLDGLSGLFALIITGIGALVLIYADAYLSGHPHIIRFYLFLNAFLMSMLGLVLSENLLVLFVFWELTTLFSFLLIGFEHQSEAARSSARQALLVTGAGGLLLLVGILLTGLASGTYGLLSLAQSGDLLRDHALYLPILACMLAGAFTKSAQVPFHFWLPNAMAAPTPISAFLHSATMVKAGIYLLARLHPILGGTPAWMDTLVIVGAATAVWGSVVALAQTDLKRVLAHTTLMALGIITMFLGGQTSPTLTAAVTFLLVHALYKSALFMVVGNIDHQAGTRQLNEIGGMGRFMPVTAIAAAMACLSMAGFPLFLGFIGKEIMYKGALTEAAFPEIATLAALTANALMAAVSATLALRPFWGKNLAKHPLGETPWQMWLGPLVLSGIGLGFGLIPDWVGRWLIQPAVQAFHPTTERIRLQLYHGINAPLLLSIVTICLGAAIYAGRRKVRAGVAQLIKHLPATMEGSYLRLLQGVVGLARWQTKILQSGQLFNYLIIIVATIVLTVGWALTSSGAVIPSWHPLTIGAWHGLLLMLMLISVAVVARSSSRLLALCGLGVIGAGVALIFLSFGAPDVALTQLLVETLTLIIAAIVFLRLPPISRHHHLGPGRRRLSLGVSIASGLLVAGLLIAVGQHDVDRTITAFYEQASYLKAHGRNIVNVILVDFRSLDTLGEIIVVASSALAGLALVRKGRADL